MMAVRSLLVRSQPYTRVLPSVILAILFTQANCKLRQGFSEVKRTTLASTEQLEADLPAEAVPQLLGDEDDLAEKQAGKQNVLNICIMSADFWGSKAAGGTATAYHLLAAVLAKEEWLNVTFLQVTQRLRICQEAQEANKRPGLSFECLSHRHFSPDVAEATPYAATSQAVVAWLIEQHNRFDIIHAHEWGGVFTDLITLNHFRQLQAGLRIAVEPHGGHVWSQLGEVNRPMDVYALRIDAYERAANALNDIEISPTSYMLAYLRQRGWTLPNTTLVIPNIIPDAEKHAVMPVSQKKVWRVAFFGRLEERKGIKVFVEAIDRLQDEYNILKKVDFEVYIVGPDAIIDMVESTQWLLAKTAHWNVKFHLKIDIPREEALGIISMEGMLLILCSYIDNMPYVVAEAATKEIPFLVFDAGGVLELFDHEEFENIIIRQATSEALASRMHEVLDAGTLTTVKLSTEVTNGKEKWLQFHKQFASGIKSSKQEDSTLVAEAEKRSKPARLVPLQVQQSALDLWEPLCLKGEPESDEVLLLLPDGYSFINEEGYLEKIGELVKIAELRHSPVKALTFGIELPNEKVAFPAAPTWIAYAGDHQHCMDDIPVAIATNTFCSAFLGQARVFQNYNAWILAYLLDHAGSIMHVYPRAFFKAAEYTSAGSSNCAAHKLPRKRAKDYVTAASRLFEDQASMMHGMVLAATKIPLASLLDDAAPAQQHKGWEYGYLDGFANQTRTLNHLSWKTTEEGPFGESLWGCESLPDDSFLEYPQFKGQLLHPCHHEGGKCCNGTVHAPFLLRFRSFIHADHASLLVSYDAFPVCGDGFDFLVTHYPADLNEDPRTLIEASYDPITKSTRHQRQSMEIPLDLRVGDQIDFVVEPRHNHDCDGLYIVEAKIWPPLDDQEAS